MQGMDAKPVAEQAPHAPFGFLLRLRAAARHDGRGRPRHGEGAAHRRGHGAGHRRPGGHLLRTPEPVVPRSSCRSASRRRRSGSCSTFHYVTQGGCEAVVYRVGEGAVQDGVQAGDWWFPGFPMPGQRQAAALRPLRGPLRPGDPGQVRLVAVDDVGNRAEAAFIDKFTPRPIHTDTIQVDDAFLNRVVPEIMSQSPEVADQGNLLENYLAINRNLRKKNARC